MGEYCFADELNARTDYADRIVKLLLPVAEEYNVELVDAMNYSVLSGGKRLRPLLIHSFYTLYGGADKIDRPFMAGLEMLHTYSLVHDDLPAIDNDELRRGLETTHKRYGEALGILAGDGLLHEAYEVIVRSIIEADERDREYMLRALHIFGSKSGIHGMLGGQTADVVHSGERMSDELLSYVYEYKTGALLEGAMMIGASLAGASEDDLKIIEQIGSQIGLAFQIKDDILDLTGDTNTLGKPVHSDDRNDKKTYVTVHGLEQSQMDVECLTHKAQALLESCGSNSTEREFLVHLFDYLTMRVN